MNKPFSQTYRVYYEDTDAMGIVYYANYLKFAERGRTEWLRHIGFAHSKMIEDQGIMFVVKSCLLNCLAPARLDDVLEVRTRFKKPGFAKLELIQEILRGEQMLATLDVVLACINSSGKPVKLDEKLRHFVLTYGSEVEK